MVFLKGVAAIVVGIAVYSLMLVGATWVANAALGLSESELINHSVATQVLWLVWNVVSMVAAGYVSAAIAPRAPGARALVMGAIQALFTLGAMFTAHRDLTPQWLWIALIVATIPGAWLGARLRVARTSNGERQSNSRPSGGLRPEVGVRG